MGRRVVAIGCALLLGLLLDTNRSFAQTSGVVYQGCGETIIDRNGDGVFSQDEAFEGQGVFVIVGPALPGEAAFNLSVSPWALQGQERVPMAGDILVHSALSTPPPHLATCQPSSFPIVYWHLQRLEGDLSPCAGIFGTRQPSFQLNAIPDDFEHIGIIASDVCGVLASDHIETNCPVNIVRSTLPDVPVVVEPPIEEGAILYGSVELFDGIVDLPLEQVDLIIEGTARVVPDQSSMFRSEIHAELALEGQQPPQCSP